MSMIAEKLGTKSLAEFDIDLKKLSIRGQWQFDQMMEALKDGPRPAGVPHLWAWKDLHAALVEACDVMPESFTARRNLSLINPGLERGGTTHSILMGMQMVRPGEVAWAHRHPISALRFAIEGDTDLFTVVDGEVMPMEPNDLVLTPPWTWHDHHNRSHKDGIWLDVLDVPLILSLNQMAYEPLGESTQPIRSDKKDYHSERTGNVRPLWEAKVPAETAVRYPWRQVRDELKRFAHSDGSPYDGVILEYVNPMTGGPALPTLGCYIQSLPRRFSGKVHRHTSSTVYYVVEGRGKTIVGDKELEWSPRDVFVVPNWAYHNHINGSHDGEAVLFSVSDAPLLEALGLYREQPELSLRKMRPPVKPLAAREA
jgi:gentisate 1,2-dioxygenase